MALAFPEPEHALMAGYASDISEPHLPCSQGVTFSNHAREGRRVKAEKAGSQPR